MSFFPTHILYSVPAVNLKKKVHVDEIRISDMGGDES